MSDDLVKQHGLNRMQVVASCSHDTGAAVAAVPAVDERWAYLSSGTWSLMGVELSEPIINDLSMERSLMIGSESSTPMSDQVPELR